MWREWKIKFLNVVNTHTPLRAKRVRSKRSPWITSELKNRMHERDNIKLKAHQERKGIFAEHKNDSRRTWQTINELTSRKSNTSSIKELIVNGVSINKTTDLANAFNEHFSTIGPVVLNILTSLTKDYVLLRQIAVKYFHY